MYSILDLLLNKMFIAPVVAWVIAQAIKILIDCYICESGGMPSSVAATVVALIVITGACIGTGSFEFAMAFFFGFITLYDARGVRFETQRQGKALNNLNDEREEEGKQPLEIKRFKEKVGHTMSELVVGGIIGLVSAVVVYYLPL